MFRVARALFRKGYKNCVLFSICKKIVPSTIACQGTKDTLFTVELPLPAHATTLKSSRPILWIRSVRTLKTQGAS